MVKNSVDLAGLFGSVTQALAENQRNLNQADEYNSDHGDNMVRTFETITGALEKKKGSSASTALSYAARQLSKSTSSGSGKLYAQNLSQAAAQLKGKSLDQRGALDLLQTLIGGGQTTTTQAPAQGGSGDLLGTLLGGMAGSGQTQTPAQGAQGGMDDLLGALLGGMGGNQQAPAQSGGQQSGLDLGDLLTGAMAFMQAKQSGGDTLQSLVQAFMVASGMGSSADRQQSTQIVINSFLQALSQGAK